MTADTAAQVTVIDGTPVIPADFAATLHKIADAIAAGILPVPYTGTEEPVTFNFFGPQSPREAGAAAAAIGKVWAGDGELGLEGYPGGAWIALRAYPPSPTAIRGDSA